jgi:peptidoglycan/xylan/chitin deacetylase (PgdA/CDA1 family)
MQFTYRAYSDLIELLKERKYTFSNYFDYKEIEKPVIFRHDIDSTLEKALCLAKLEKQKGVVATYFVLLSTNFYNVFSKESYEILKEIENLGHEIGLHFDEKRYPINNAAELEYFINKERKVLEGLLDKKIRTVSMHRPSKWILENNIQFNSILNTYSKTFFKDFKYVSDSRMHWREDVLNIIKKESFNKLHILTHPFWYSTEEESLKKKLYDFVTKANKERYLNQKENFRNLEEILREGEI